LERLKIIRFSSISDCQDLLKTTGGDSLNIKGITISHMAAVRPGALVTGSPTERRRRTVAG